MPCKVNVTSPPHNAVGYSAADDTVAIQRAVNRASENGGGTNGIPDMCCRNSKVTGRMFSTQEPRLFEEL